MIEVQRLETKAHWLRSRAGWIESREIRERLCAAAEGCEAQAAARRLQLVSA